MSYDVADATTETAFVFGELYLRAGQWKFRAVGQGWESGLAGLATDYGITVAQDAQPGDPAETSPEVDERTAPPGPLGENGLEDGTAPVETGPVETVEVGAEVDTVPTAPANTADDDAAAESDLSPFVVDEPAAESVTDLSTAEPTKRPRTLGIQTRKVRPKPLPLAALTLADGPHWNAARLFSIYAVGTLDEQEKRATSALLSTLMAVREFGRALISRLGGPAGTIETYQEVPFKIGDRTVSPDGVIRVARGGKVWTALLETKTGTNALRAGQIDAYLDVAAAKGYDAVVTLSNEIAMVGGEHPAGVDRRRVKKVALQHLSWSEVLHEAQMQLLHRGVDDKLQAWILAELIRYLEHPRSGAAGFDDMGAGWVPVREAIHSGMLRPNNTKIVDVVQAWDKLPRHMGMKLTSQLGCRPQW